MRGSACDVILGSCAVRLPFGLPAPPAIVLRAHRESVSGLAGFSLGFRSTLPRSAGWFCTVDLNLYGYIWGTVIAQRFGFANMKSNAHLNCSRRRDQNPQAKARQTRDTFAMNIIFLHWKSS